MEGVAGAVPSSVVGSQLGIQVASVGVTRKQVCSQPCRINIRGCEQKDKVGVIAKGKEKVQSKEREEGTQRVQLEFMFGLGDKITHEHILHRLYLESGSPVNSLKLLCTLWMVCRAWRQHIDRSKDWKVVRGLYQEDLAAFNEELWVELEAEEEEQSESEEEM
jgi:hypothetical protein